MSDYQIFKKTSMSVAVAAATVLSFQSSALLADEALLLEEIIVTATGREQSMQEIPYNISAVSGEDLAAAGIVDAVDVMRGIAGVTVIDRGYRNSGMVNGIIIRGMNVDSGSNGDVPLVAVPTIASYVDGTALHSNFILKDIDRVEVLRGPQGTLYGSGSLAGTVRYLMNKPDMVETYGSVSANYGVTEGSEGFNLTTDAMINLPISDKLAVRANIGEIDNDGIIDYANVYKLENDNPIPDGGDLLTDIAEFERIEDADSVDIRYARASVLFEPTDTFSAQLSYQQQEDKIGGRRQTTTGKNGFGESYGDYENGAIMLEPSEREVELTSLELIADLGFATLTSTTSDYTHEGTGENDNTGVYASYDWLKWYGNSPRPMHRASRFYDQSALTQELRLVSNAEDAFVDWIAGVYYHDADNNSGQDSRMVGYKEFWAAGDEWDVWPGRTTEAYLTAYGQVTENDFYYRRAENFKDKAIYGEITLNFSEELHLTLGARSFKNTISNSTQLDIPVWNSDPDGPGSSFVDIQGTGSEKDTLLKANLSWNLDDATMVYGTIAEGYRRGGSNVIPLTGRYAENPDWLTYKSDTVVNYELGLKGQTNTFSYTASLFYMDWKDPQLNTTADWGFFTVANGEAAVSQGIELELNGELNEQLSYTLGYTYADAKLKGDLYSPTGDVPSDSLATVKKASDGEALPGTPKSTFNIGLAYATELADMDWNTVVNGYYQSSTRNALGDNENFTADMSGFQLWNVNTTLSKNKWAASLYIKNVFNEDGTTGVVTEGYMGTNPDRSFYGNASKNSISQPRTLGLSAAYNF